MNHARKADSERHRLNKDDLEGTGWLKNLVDNVLLIERIRNQPKKIEATVHERVKVAKNRYNGREGSVWFRFDSARLSYEEVKI